MIPSIRKIIRVILFITLIFLFAFNLFAQIEIKPSDKIEIKKSFIGNKYIYKNKNYGYFNMSRILKVCPKANHELKIAKGMFLIGNAILWVGAAYTGTFLGSLAFYHEINIAQGSVGNLGLFSGGFMVVNSQKRLNKAAILYNRYITDK
ncbi:MAG: hypothetical protein HY738_24055 [Bacteroidia bacterium]|nr:hypothetical protein [Bacteroidia bacterium]